mmetsp:Transcript_34887/g.82195  ORF Transcript_34887/g.82195 Transcript_34887/m.82195 type:complete len:223 (+) Transcript_34887:12654-13322(+)
MVPVEGVDPAQDRGGGQVLPAKSEASRIRCRGSWVFVVEGDLVRRRVRPREIERTSSLAVDCQRVPLLDDNLVVNPKLHTVILDAGVRQLGVERVDASERGRNEARPAHTVLGIRKTLILDPSLGRMIIISRGEGAGDVTQASDGFGILAVRLLVHLQRTTASMGEVNRLVAGLSGCAPRRVHRATETRVIGEGRAVVRACNIVVGRGQATGVLGGAQSDDA